MSSFQEIGTFPSTMGACRILLVAFSLRINTKLLQSGCVRAYVQAPMKGMKTYTCLRRLGGQSIGLDIWWTDLPVAPGALLPSFC